MNNKIIINVIGKVFLIIAGLMCAPLVVGFIYGENEMFLGYIIPIVGLVLLGIPALIVKPEDKAIYAKEGFVIVALTWVFVSLIGSIPFIINKEIPRFIDAFFETTSGFTTTGSSVLSGEQIENLSKSGGFWRIFSHFIGGMGVLVFVLAVIPENSSGAMHLFRTESPGPSAQKFVSKIRFTARILYLIYISLTVLEFLLLLIGKMSVYDALLHAFSTAGTGGLSTKADSIASFNSVYVEMVIATFMFLFGINFNVFYLIITGHFIKAIKGEEIILYFSLVFLSVIFIAINISSLYGGFVKALRYSYFQSASISSTTGFTTADFNEWPAFSKSILIFLMIIGGCGGSTGGGIKVSRLAILLKSSFTDLKTMQHPRSVVSTKFENESLDNDTVKSVRTYFLLWVALVIACTLILSLDCNDWLTDFTATLASIGNVGPGMNFVGPTYNYADFSWYSKLTLCFTMLAGRLELFPMLILFNYKTWKRK